MKNQEEYSEVVAGFESYITNNGKAPIPEKGSDGKYLSAQMQARFYGFKAAYDMYVNNK